MNTPWHTRIKFAPRRQYFEASIQRLAPAQAHALLSAWWNEPCVDPTLASREVDRHWDWATPTIEYEGRYLPHILVGLFVASELEGAMLLSTAPVASMNLPGTHALLLERLVTAPRNRPHLRRDRNQLPWFTNVGTELIKWAAVFSREQGYHGQLRLDASPRCLHWYHDRHFEFLANTPKIEFEGTLYTPMELPAAGAARLLAGQPRPGTLHDAKSTQSLRYPAPPRGEAAPRAPQQNRPHVGLVA